MVAERLLIQWGSGGRRVKISNYIIVKSSRNSAWIGYSEDIVVDGVTSIVRRLGWLGIEMVINGLHGLVDLVEVIHLLDTSIVIIKPKLILSLRHSHLSIDLGGLAIGFWEVSETVVEVALYHTLSASPLSLHLELLRLH
jgi:hypothetical protein